MQPKDWDAGLRGAGLRIEGIMRLWLAVSAIAVVGLLPLASWSRNAADAPAAPLSRQERIAELMLREELAELSDAGPKVICVALQAMIEGNDRLWEPSKTLVQRMDSAAGARRVLPMSACRCGGPMSERSTGEQALLFVADEGNYTWWYPGVRPPQPYIVQGKGRNVQVTRYTGIGEIAVDTFGYCPLQF